MASASCKSLQQLDGDRQCHIKQWLHVASVMHPWGMGRSPPQNPGQASGKGSELGSFKSAKTDELDVEGHQLWIMVQLTVT